MKNKIRNITQMSCLLLFMISSFVSKAQTNTWIAPEESKKMVSPIPNDDKTISKGKKIYYQICATCHGRTGVGDGPAGVEFTPKPADHTSDNVQNQSDGELYWKITNGRGDMPTYNQLLSKTQRWQVLAFIRTLNPN